MHSVKVTIFSSELVFGGNISVKKTIMGAETWPRQMEAPCDTDKVGGGPLHLNKCLKHNNVRKVIFIQVAYLLSAWDEYGENECFGVSYFYAHNVSLPEG